MTPLAWVLAVGAVLAVALLAFVVFRRPSTSGATAADQQAVKAVGEADQAKVATVQAQVDQEIAVRTAQIKATFAGTIARLDEQERARIEALSTDPDALSAALAQAAAVESF